MDTSFRPIPAKRFRRLTPEQLAAQRKADAAFMRAVIADMRLKPGITLAPVNRDRVSTAAWRA